MAPNTGRNRAVYLLACRVGRWCHAGVLSTREVGSAIVSAAMANGLVQADGLKSVHASIVSGFNASANDSLPNLGSTGLGKRA